MAAVEAPAMDSRKGRRWSDWLPRDHRCKRGVCRKGEASGRHRGAYQGHPSGSREGFGWTGREPAVCPRCFKSESGRFVDRYRDTDEACGLSENMSKER